jgi:hypothetical protein
LPSCCPYLGAIKGLGFKGSGAFHFSKIQIYSRFNEDDPPNVRDHVLFSGFDAYVAQVNGFRSLEVLGANGLNG